MIDARLIKNIAYLGSIQGLSFILPLATVPVLVSKLGIEVYGEYAFILALVQYLILFVDYGFSLSATKMIALHRDNKEKTNIIFWCVISSKLLIFIVFFSMVLLFTLLLGVSDSYAIGAISVIGSVFFPVWLFQAREMMATLAIFNVIGRLVAFVALLICLDYSATLNTALYINVISSMLPSLLSVWFVFNRKIVRSISVDKKVLLILLKESGQIFISNFMSTMYTNSVLVFIGLYYSNSVVGFFSAADKVRVAIQALIAPVSQALYPRMSIALAKGDSNKRELYILGGFLISTLLSISLLISFFSYELSLLLFGDNAGEIARYLRYLILIPPVVAAANMFGLQVLLPLGRIIQFRNTYIVSSMFGITSIFFSLNYWGVESLPFAILFTEVSVLLQLFYYSLPYLRSKF